VVNHNDDEAFKRVINYPARGIGDTTMDRLQNFATQNGISLWDVFNTINAERIGIRVNTSKKIKDFVELINNFTLRAINEDAYQVAYDLLKQSGVIAALKEDKSVESIAKYENIEEFLNSIKEFVDTQVEENEYETMQVTPISQYLENIALITDADTDKPEDKNKVTLMTVHSAKGLEFDYVYVVGMEDGLFPGYMAIDSIKELEEERRLFYVAVTRAAKKITMSYAQTRYRWGQLVSNKPSRFMKEIDSVYLEHAEWIKSKKNNNIDTELCNNDYSATRQANTIDNESIDGQHDKEEKISKQGNTHGLSIGMEVEHERFGSGKIIDIDDNGGDSKAIVNFYTAGKKTLLLKFARLKIIK
jgi:DNA helicase-2/ATP-dependent DNA helicase PcrA